MILRTGSCLSVVPSVCDGGSVCESTEPNAPKNASGTVRTKSIMTRSIIALNYRVIKLMASIFTKCRVFRGI